MQLGKDFVIVARLVIAIIRAILEVFNSNNGDTDGEKEKV